MTLFFLSPLVCLLFCCVGAAWTFPKCLRSWSFNSLVYFWCSRCPWSLFFTGFAPCGFETSVLRAQCAWFSVGNMCPVGP